MRFPRGGAKRAVSCGPTSFRRLSQPTLFPSVTLSYAADLRTGLGPQLASPPPMETSFAFSPCYPLGWILDGHGTFEPAAAHWPSALRSFCSALAEFPSVIYSSSLRRCCSLRARSQSRLRGAALPSQSSARPVALPRTRQSQLAAPPQAVCTCAPAVRCDWPAARAENADRLAPEFVRLRLRTFVRV
eukprot:scaffold1311_cov256-Pinguiococcus_pyrenoidosus.AAC.28